MQCYINFNFYTESSALMYLRADFNIGSSEMIELNNLKYHVLGESFHGFIIICTNVPHPMPISIEKRPVRSTRQSIITGYATLFVLSPTQGSVSYEWEKKGDWTHRKIL